MAEFSQLDDAAFRASFSGSPIKRIGRDRFIRNVLIAIGNSGDASLVPYAERLLGDASALVRAMAVWALGRLNSPDAFGRLRSQWRPRETDQTVADEWQTASPAL